MVRKFRRMIKSKSILKKKRGKTMKKFTKIMLSVAAVTAVSTAMAISAMAAVEGTYDAETGKVTLTGVESSGDQQTLLVLSEDAETVTEGIIRQIDQDTAISEFILEKGITSGTYYVRIGGTDGTLQKYTLVIGGEQPGGETETIVIGDTSGDDIVNATDVGHLSRYSVGFDSRIGSAGKERVKADSSKVVIGDTSGDGIVNATDVGHASRYSVGFDSRVGSAGQSVEVVKE